MNGGMLARRRRLAARLLKAAVAGACLVSVFATTACDRGARDDTVAAAGDVAGARDSATSVSDGERWTDRELDVKSFSVPTEGRDSISIARKVADARRAGPESIATAASIIDRAAEEGGAMLPIKAGTNDWVCVPDDPITPVDDPVCLNKVAQRWASAIYKGSGSFRHEGLGVGYKLRGGAIASNTDPFLIRPSAGNSWVIEPPHVLLMFEDTTGLSDLPDDPAQGGPWVSWRGTPYMTVKVPIAP
jgi:hypothetical protein